MKIKQFLLTIAFVISAYISEAQSKYEYMIIEYSVFPTEISVSIDGVDIYEEKLKYSKEDKTTLKANPMLVKVKEYEDEDWEVMNFDTVIKENNYRVYYAYLRKKRE